MKRDRPPDIAPQNAAPVLDLRAPKDDGTRAAVEKRRRQRFFECADRQPNRGRRQADFLTRAREGPVLDNRRQVLKLAIDVIPEES